MPWVFEWKEYKYANQIYLDFKNFFLKIKKYYFNKNKEI
jgi:hypothetical protein